MFERVRCSADESAVFASINLANALETQGASIVHMHEGAEETMPEGDLENLLTYDGQNSSAYNPILGLDEMREICAAFARNFLGLNATAKNTFFIQDGGRVLLQHAFHAANSDIIRAKMSPVALAPKLRWAVTDELAEMAYTDRLIPYETQRGNLAAEIKAKLDALTELDDDEVPGFLYVNLPHNPTGYAASPQEGREILEAVKAYNEKTQRHLVLIDDNPYFANLKQRTDGEDGPELRSVFQTAHMEHIAPSMHIVSFSKAFGTATIGGSFIVVDDESKLAKMEQAIGFNSGGFFSPVNVRNLAALLSPENYPQLRAHLKKLRDKYVENNMILSDVFAKHSLSDCIVDGDPGMVRALKIPAAMMNRRIVHNSETYDIRTARDVVEYLANAFHVVTVPQYDQDGEVYIRIALKAEDTRQIEKGALGIAHGLKTMLNAPDLAAA